MRRLLTLLAVTGSVAACGTTEIDAGKTEAFIDENVTEQTGARVETVECPEGLEAKKGRTFECTVTGDDGSSGKAQVTERDDEGNVEVTAQFVHVRNLEDLISGGIAEQSGGGEVTVECPEIIVGAKGDTFECEASGRGDTATVLVTQTNGQGDVRYEVQG